MCLNVFSSCTDLSAQNLHKEFRQEYNYFMALKALKNDDEKSAVRLLKKSLSSKNEKIRRLAAEKLTETGNIAERNKAAAFLLKNYDDEKAAVKGMEVLFLTGEYNSVVLATDSINLEKDSNQLVFYRLKSLEKKHDSRFYDEAFLWFTSRSVSNFHEELFSSMEKKFQGAKIFAPENSAETLQSQETVPEQFKIIFYRMLVFRKNYKAAFMNTENLLQIYKAKNSFPPYQIISDMGKAALYATDDFYNSGKKFQLLAEKLSGEEAYCSYFYAARLYDRAGRFQSKTQETFFKALNSTSTPEHYDNALWYLLNFQLRQNSETIISTLKNNLNKIGNSFWFEDFFDSLSVLLLSHRDFETFYKVYKLIDGTLDEEITGRYAYISARLLEEGLVSPLCSPAKEAVDCYAKVINGNAPLYYKVCAMDRLNVRDKSYMTDIFSTGKGKMISAGDKNTQKIFSAFAAFGFPEMILPFWQNEKENLSVESAVQAAEFLSSCGEFNRAYSVQSLRLSARAMNFYAGKLPFSILNLTFPQVYKNFTEEACEKTSIPLPVLFSLIRSESFFDAEISSRAGAMGLTQLMTSTAQETAKKIGLKEDFDILDPKTNITLGSAYLESLIKRTGKDSLLPALFAYNAGLSNVRKWKNDGLPMDIFLETMPFAETREYGRKIISSAAMYDFLYYGKVPSETLRYFFP